MYENVLRKLNVTPRQWERVNSLLSDNIREFNYSGKTDTYLAFTVEPLSPQEIQDLVDQIEALPTGKLPREVEEDEFKKDDVLKLKVSEVEEFVSSIKTLDDSKIILTKIIKSLLRLRKRVN